MGTAGDFLYARKNHIIFFAAAAPTAHTYVHLILLLLHLVRNNVIIGPVRATPRRVQQQLQQQQQQQQYSRRGNRSWSLGALSTTALAGRPRPSVDRLADLDSSVATFCREFSRQHNRRGVLFRWSLILQLFCSNAKACAIWRCEDITPSRNAPYPGATIQHDRIPRKLMGRGGVSL